MRERWERIVVDKVRDEDGYYFSIDNGDVVGPFVTEKDRDRELEYEIARIGRSLAAAGRRLRPSSGGGSWVIEPQPVEAAA